jgi:hypothetical protein
VVLGRIALLAMIAAWAGGCVAAGFAAQALQGPPKRKALYEPDPRPMVVLVENARQQGSAGPIRELLTGLLNQALRENKVADPIPGYKLHDLRMADAKAFRDMNIDEVGRRVGAEQVLYVEIVRADIETHTGDTLVSGAVQVLVRVVDVPTGKTLWPDNSLEGWPVIVETPTADYKKVGGVQPMREALARATASKIAKLFYTHLIEE